MNVWGQHIKLSIFGESHGDGIGIVIDGLKAGFTPDFDAVNLDMARRRGDADISTARREADKVEVLSGLFNGTTTGAPLCAIIRNLDTRSSDYCLLPRPGHADYVAFVKHNGFNDYRGGGHFSGRITAPLVFAGSLAKQLLAESSIAVSSVIKQIGSVTGNEPVLSDAMREVILNAKKDGTSVGGVVELTASGVPVGLGEPFFGSVESVISSMFFSIPAVKAVGFGLGYGFASAYGHEVNDQYCVRDGKIQTKTNFNGGINGGITNGEDIVVSACIKPTPSIYKEQDSVDMKTLEEQKLTIRGRHDPCIVPRAAVVLEAALALCIWELMV